MPVSRAAVLRLPRACVSSPSSSSPLLLRLRSTPGQQQPPCMLLIVPLSRQCRFASTTPPRQDKATGRPGRSSRAKRTFWQSLKHDTGRAWYVMKNTSLITMARESPFETAGGIFALLTTIGVVIYGVWVYKNHFHGPQFNRFPEPIAAALRKALYFSDHEPDPKRALKYYQQALELCDQHGLDHFSDEVMGVKIRIVAWLEKIGSYKNAIGILENMLNDCQRWVEVFEKSEREGTLPKPPPPPPPQEGDAEPAPEPKPWEDWRAKRTRIMTKAVSISVKLANLYSDEHVLDRERAHERLVWAVETILGEQQRRVKEGVKEKEGPWLSPEEIGGSFEELAQSYVHKSEYHLALPLFFQALRLCDEPCHMAMLMNNISTSFAEHPLIAPGDAPVDALLEDSKQWVTAAQQRASYLASAQRWAQNAITHASEPKGDKRTEECDGACAAALTNLGAVFALMGKVPEAREKYQQAAEMARKLGIEESVAQAEEGLKSLSALPPAKA